MPPVKLESKRKWASKGHYCAAINCSRNRRDDRNLSFFRFPKNHDQSQKWVINCRRDDMQQKTTEQLSKGSVLCSLHFEDCMFMNRQEKNRLIPKIAIPTLFTVPNPPTLVTPKRQTRKVRVPVVKRRKTDKLPVGSEPELETVTVTLPVSRIEELKLKKEEPEATNEATHRIIYPAVVPNMQDHLVNTHPKFWQSLSPPTVTTDDVKFLSSRSSESSGGCRTTPCPSFEYSISSDSTTIHISAIRIQNLKCSSTKVIFQLSILVPEPCCNVVKLEQDGDEDPEIRKKDEDLNPDEGKGDEECGNPAAKEAHEPSTTNNQAKALEYILDGSSSDNQLLGVSSVRDRNSLSTQNSDVPDGVLEAEDMSLFCQACKQRYVMKTAACFDSKVFGFKKEITLGEIYHVKMVSGGPFWMKIMVVEKEDPQVVVCSGRSTDMYIQDYEQRTMDLETSIKESKGSALISLRYLPLTQKMTIALLESKQVEGMDVENANDLYMKTCVLCRSSSNIRSRTHGPPPVEIHDNIALWTDHQLSFDIPREQMNKVTIVADIIQKKISCTDCDDYGDDPSTRESSLPQIMIDPGPRDESDDALEQGTDRRTVSRKKLGRLILGADASTNEGRQQWTEALDNTRTEVLYWHPLC